VAQGAIGVEIREGDERIHALVGPLHDTDTATCVTAERAFLARLEGGCQVPIAGHAVLRGDVLDLEGLVGEVDGSHIIRRRTSGPRGEAEAIGERLATEVLDAGAREILARLYAG
jgi:Porphobilinogen deaminase